MSNPVELRLAISDEYPSGTGSYYYEGHFTVVVQNINYNKQVAIWGRSEGSGWQEYRAHYAESLPENRELWQLDMNTIQLTEFDARYSVGGITYWDNNCGNNYRRPEVHDEFAALLGNVPQVVLGSASFTDSTHITVLAGLRNLDYTKTVGIVYTTDRWVTSQRAYGQYYWTMLGGTEVWRITASVASGQTVEYAIFYRVLGKEYWDNNFWRNYSLAPPVSMAPARAVTPIARRQERAWERAA